MKFLSFLVFAAITTSVHCRTDPPNPTEQVRDTDGDLVRVNTYYYILPATKENGGGLVLRNRTQESCPLGIFQDDEDNENHGTPVSFYPVNSKKSVIRVSVDLNIEFSGSPVDCDHSNIWKVDNYKRNPERFYISPDGVKGHPGLDTVGNWFKIEKFESGYKLVHCPSVADDKDDNDNNDKDEDDNDDNDKDEDEDEVKVLCKDLGLLKFSGQQRLALSDTPFGVVFQKA